MIFADIRISRLQRDLEEKRTRFQISQTALLGEITQQLKPLNFIKNHPAKILSTAVAGAAFFAATRGLMSRFFSPNGINGSGVLKLGFFRNALQMGGLLALKSVFPILRSLLRFFLKQFFGR